MFSLVFELPAGQFVLQAAQRRLLRDGAELPLGARALDLLLALASRPGEVVSRQALLDHVWGDAPVEENNLSVQVNALRKTLGADAVRTVPGRGYLLACELGAAPGGTERAAWHLPGPPLAVLADAAAAEGIPLVQAEEEEEKQLPEETENH